MKPRVVFDCVVFLQGVGRPASPARACFALVDAGAAELCLSVEVLAEVRDVLTRPKMRKRFPRLTPERVEAFLQNAERQALLLPVVPQVFALPRDPKDERYVNLAVAAGARYLITRDQDLLDLMKEGLPEAKDFRERFSDLTILDPVAFLRELTPDQGTSPNQSPA